MVAALDRTATPSMVTAEPSTPVEKTVTTLPVTAVGVRGFDR